MLTLAALLILLCGVAVGATSIGGVLVVPVLTSLAAVPPDRAVAAASFGFAFTGVAAFAWRGSSVTESSALAGTSSAGTLRMPGPWALHGAALVGAALGAITLAWIPAAGVRWTVGVLAIASGTYALAGRQRQRAVVLPVAGVVALGLAVGCASAWSGTGGPVVLLPALALLGAPVGFAVSSAQRIQLPVALAASVVNFAAGRLDLWLGLALGLLVLAGWSAGRWLSQRLPARRLQQAVAVALIAAGAAYLAPAA